MNNELLFIVKELTAAGLQGEQLVAALQALERIKMAGNQRLGSALNIQPCLPLTEWQRNANMRDIATSYQCVSPNAVGAFVREA
jgi:hypothetical protein